MAQHNQKIIKVLRQNEKSVYFLKKHDRLSELVAFGQN